MIVLKEDPIQLPARERGGKDSQLQPDISLVKMDTEADDMIEAYGHGSNPSAKDTLSAIEICKTTQRRDREEKLPRYAPSGVPEGDQAAATPRPRRPCAD